MLAARKIIDETVNETQATAQASLKLYSDARTNKNRKRKRELKIDIMICVGAILLMCLTYTSLEAKITTVGYEINQLQAQIAEVENVNSRLMLEVEELSSPESIAKFAATQEGMVKSTEKNIIYQKMDSSNHGLQVAAGMSTVTPGQGSVKVEVLADGASHPILDVLGNVFDSFSQANNTQLGQIDVSK